MKKSKDEKEGVVIDVEPVEEAVAEKPAEPDEQTKADASEESPPDEPEPEPAVAQEPRKSGGRGAAIFGILLALIALAAVGGLGFYGNQQLQSLQTELATLDRGIAGNAEQQQSLTAAVGDASTALEQQTSQVTTLAGEFKQQLAAFDEQKSAFTAQKTAFAEQEKLLADERIRMEEREAELRATVADVHQRMGRSGTEWMIAEAEYLMRLAQHRLRLAGDVGAARAALEIADQRLRDTGDPGWAGVREQVARDIATLDVLEAPDLSGLSARLGALAEEVPKLKLTEDTGAQPARPPSPVKTAADASTADTARQFIDDFWAGLKNSVRIRRHDKPVQAMLAPQHQFFLFENLRLQLETARLALARGDQTLFEQTLQRTDVWLGNYFLPDDAATVAMRKAVTELAGQKITTDLPDISTSLRALHARMRLLDRIGDVGQAAGGAAPAAEAKDQGAAGK